MSSFAFPFVPVATQALQRLQTNLSSKTQLDYLLTQLGWDADIDAATLLEISQAFNLGDSLDSLAALADDLRHQRGDVLAVAQTLFAKLKELFSTISGLQAAASLPQEPFSLPGFWPAMAQDLVPYLLARELKRTSPLAYALLFLIGVIQEEEVVPTAAERLPYTRISLHWAAIGDFLHAPVATLATRYGWGQGQVLAYQLVLRELVELASLFPITPRLGAAPAAIATKYYATSGILESQKIKSLILPFVSGLRPDRSETVELGLSLTPIPTVALSGDAPAGFLLAPYLHGSAAQTIPLRSDLLLTFKEGFASDNAVGVEILPGGLRLESDPGSTALGAEISLVGSPAEPLRFFGSDTTSRLELTGYALSVGMAGTLAQPELLLRAGTALAGGPGRLVLYLEPGDGDNFLAQAFGPKPVKLEVGGALTWSSRTGLGLDGAAGLHLRRATNQKVGPLTLHDYALDIDGQTSTQGTTPLAAAFTLGASLQLGPITATVEKMGVTFKLATPAAGQKGVLDNVDVTWGFQAPTGVGLAIKSDLLNGGGYLYLDPARHTYSGVANLHLEAGGKDININALGLLQTQLPGRPDDYSLVLLLTATFGAIELGLGFKLTGLGGVLGVNRSFDPQYLLGLVRGGQLDKLLFPANVMDDPTAALALVDAAFPATPGRYVIGLMAQLGWGTRTLITLDVALLVELPAPVRLAVLGVLQAVLPGPPNQPDLLKLRADFLGTIDFGAKKVAFDASLVQSHILKYTLTGDMAFRLYQGDNPLFVITAGGFHPAFQPPAGAGLTGLKRLTLNLSQSSDLQLTLASYFAVTSNTVQFGAHLDLVYRIGRGFRVEGHFGFDVLFQFSPFRVLAHVEAGVAIKAGGSELLSMHLALDVAGPGPWHVWGEASFRIWFVKISVDVNATIGDRSPETTGPQLAPDVATPLRAALRDAASWEVEAPRTAALPGGVVLRPADAPAGQLFLDPRGALVVRQHVAPLGLALEKFGASAVAPVGGAYFRLTGVLLNGEEYPGASHPGGTEPVSDFFVPEQFRRLTDAQKLSLPSFQLLPSGLRLKSLASLTAPAQSALRVVRYEKKVLSSRPQSGGTPKLKMDPTAFQRLAQGGALGQAVQAARPSARAPQPVGWQEDTYEVVHADTLVVYSQDADNQQFQGQVLAEQYCQRLVAAHPELDGELLVMPTYQLQLA